MGSLTNRAETLLADHLCNDAYTPVATVYLALASADPAETATGSSFNELANTGAYARTAITFGAAASRQVAQTGAVAYATATTAWTTAAFWAICTTALYATGDVLAYGSLATAKRITANSSGSVASGEVTVDGEFFGTLNRDEDEGEISYALNVVILEEDLPEPPAIPRR